MTQAAGLKLGSILIAHHDGNQVALVAAGQELMKFSDFSDYIYNTVFFIFKYLNLFKFVNSFFY